MYDKYIVDIGTGYKPAAATNLLSGVTSNLLTCCGEGGGGREEGEGVSVCKCLQKLELTDSGCCAVLKHTPS